MRKVKMGIVGIGGIGTSYGGQILSGKTPEISLEAVSTRNPERQAWIRENWPGVKVYATAGELIDSGDCEAILIATPHPQHPEIAKQAFEAGLHVLCEKPAGVSVADVAGMIRAAEDAGTVFGMMYNQRTNPLFKKMRDVIASGELGAIRRTNWIITDWFRPQAYYESSPWRATWRGEGGGVLLNQSIHNLDLMQWICGMPSRICAFCHEGKWHDIEVEDDVTAYLEYPDGATGVFVTSTGDAPGTNRFEISCDRGKLLFEHGTLTMYKTEESIGAFSLSAQDGFAKPKAQKTVLEPEGEYPAHAGVMNAFAGAVLRGEPLVAEGAEGIHAVMLANAMHLSSWQSKPVVLPLDEEAFARALNRKIADAEA